MKKTALIAFVAQQTNLNKNKADAVVSEFVAQITNALSREEPVNIFGFGRLEIRYRESRQGRNPANGNVIDIPASKTVGFKPAMALKTIINI